MFRAGGRNGDCGAGVGRTTLETPFTVVIFFSESDADSSSEEVADEKESSPDQNLLSSSVSESDGEASCVGRENRDGRATIVNGVGARLVLGEDGAAVHRPNGRDPPTADIGSMVPPTLDGPKIDLEITGDDCSERLI